MNLDECCKDLPGGDWRSVVVRNLVGELIQDQNEDQILAFWRAEGDNPNDTKSNLLYYILTDKRFFEIRVDSCSFSYKSYLLTRLNSFGEKVIPYCNEQDYFKDSAYFLHSYEGVSSYTVEFSFSVAESESDKAMFSLSAPFLPSSSDWERIRFNKLRDFARGFHKAVTGL